MFRLGRSLLSLVAAYLWLGAIIGRPEESRKSDEVRVDQSFASPNGKLLATFLGGGFEIKTTATGETALVHSTPPVYKVAWTGDSKTIVTVEHLAGGTAIAVFHLKESKWQRLSVDPPGGPYERYQVIKCNVGEGTVALAYRTRSRLNGSLKNEVVSFEYDPSTARVTHVAVKPTDN